MFEPLVDTSDYDENLEYIVACKYTLNNGAELSGYCNFDDSGDVLGLCPIVFIGNKKYILSLGDRDYRKYVDEVLKVLYGGSYPIKAVSTESIGGKNMIVELGSSSAWRSLTRDLNVKRNYVTTTFILGFVITGVWGVTEDTINIFPNYVLAIGLSFMYFSFLCYGIIYLRYCFKPTQTNASALVDLGLSQPLPSRYFRYRRLDFRRNIIVRWIFAGVFIFLLLSTILLIILVFTLD